MTFYSHSTLAHLKPERRLFIEIIRSGIREYDFEYFNSELFEMDCYFAGLNYVECKRLVKRELDAE